MKMTELSSQGRLGIEAWASGTKQYVEEVMVATCTTLKTVFYSRVCYLIDISFIFVNHALASLQ
ncbi:hypothetical protein E2C01_079329 [Portunus trituberculatus]|uniref:Uncharacterized protein n=1 Tax=Portunus trituberculatus TaxID=210409 RepID=A0A5B7IT24_PORTR|nr:hypothetical protein [Portunus trituberculatus]